MKPEFSFRTYTQCSPTVDDQTLTTGERNARLEEERAMRYLDQAENSLRLAQVALQRAKNYRSGK